MSLARLVRQVVLVAVLLTLLVLPAQTPWMAVGKSVAASAPRAGRSPSPSADFNGDGFADLAIGVPYEDVESITDAGAVQVLYGSSAGLTAADDQLWTQDSPGIEDTAESNDELGRALAAGDFNGDGFADLAAGVPGEDLGPIISAGAVQVLYGSSAGLTATNDQFWTQDSPGMEDTAESLDDFGLMLAAGDFNGDGFADLAVGVPAEDLGSIVDPGAVQVLYGSSAGLTAANDQFWTQDSPGMEDIAESYDYFGALAAGDFNGDGLADLAIGVSHEDLGTKIDAGAVNVLYGSATGLSAANNQFWNQDSTAIRGQAGRQDNFGWPLAAGDFSGDGKADLAIGVPEEDVKGIESAGAVNALYGSPNGLNAANSQIWTQYPSRVKDVPESYDRFGSSLASR